MTRRLKYEVLEERVVLSTNGTLAEAMVAASAAPSHVDADVPHLAAALPIDQWVQSLIYQQFSQLLPEHVPYLTIQQVASIPEIYWFSQMRAESRAVLSAAQVRALNVRDVTLNYLTPQQVSWLTVPQIQSLKLFDFKFLSASQVPSLTPAQIATIPDPGPFVTWTPAARAALTQPQIQALKVGSVRLDLLTPLQVSWITAAQIQTLTLHDFKYLSASQVPYLTPAQIATIPDPGPFAEWSAASRAALTQPQIQALKVGSVRLDLLTPLQVSWITAAQIQTLTLHDFKYLSASQVPYLTPAQIATIPDPGPFAEWSAASRAALTQPQIQALKVGSVRLDLLTPLQVSWITAAQIQTLTLHDFKYLSASQVPYLTPAQIATIPDPGPFAEWSAASRAALTQPQIQALKVGSVRLDLLTPLQVSWITAAQIQTLTLHDFKYLSASQVPYLTPAQIATIPDPGPFATWTPAARAALTSVQVQALKVSTVRLDLLTAQQVSWLTVAQIQTLNLFDFKYLSASQVPWLTPMQVSAIPDPGPFAAWTPAARAALTNQQIPYLNVRTIGLALLTSDQVSWLKRYQVQSLLRGDFQYLHASQTPQLTPIQIASIPDPGLFAEWSPAARAALTMVQVQALKVAAVGLNLLTSQQVSWLTAAQVQSLPLHSFQYLPPSVVPYLTPAQIATIPDPGPFATWTAASRAALTAPQIQALKVSAVRLNLLTAQQVSWLTVAQIQSLTLHDFQYLSPSQVPSLTPAQIAGIPDPAPFVTWTAASRAALTAPQIRALDVAHVGINFLTAPQVSWLTAAQIASLRWEQISYLSPTQIPYVTPAQVASFPDGAVLRSLPEELQTRFSQEQLLAMSPQMWAEYTSSPLIPPSNYVPAVDVPVVDGMPATHAAHLEAERVLNLVPLTAATHVSVASGNWSNPAVWSNGRVPTPGAKVVISAGTTVRYDAVLQPVAAINTLRIDGTFTFATNINTQLVVDTVVVTATGKLHVGTASAPIADNVRARIVISDGGPINTTWDPYLLSRGILSQGEVRMHGKSVTPYVTLATAPSRGATQLNLTGVPANWKVGDVLVLSGTHQYVRGNLSEVLTIRAMNGSTVVVDPLQYDHYPPSGYGLSIYLANVTRNIELVAVDAAIPGERPHLMFFHNPNVAVENVSVTGFGRTNKDIEINDPVVVNGVLQPGTGLNPRARYAMHFHHTGVNPAYNPAIVRGSVILGSPGWGYVNHSSNVTMENNISYETFGAGFVTEDGNEIGVMRGNLALNSNGSGDHPQSREDIHDFGHGGHGFWLQGPGVAVINNIAAGHGGAAFIYFTTSSKNLFDAVNLDDPSLAGGHKAVPVGSVPLKEFSGNVALTSKTGLEIWFHMNRANDGQSLVEDFTAWNMRVSGIDLRYMARLEIRDVLLLGDMQTFRGTGIAVNHETGDIIMENLRVAGFETGVVAPPRRTNVIYSGTFNNLLGIYVDGATDLVRTLNIGGNLVFQTATPAQLGSRQQYRVYTVSQLDFRHRSVEVVLAPDRVWLTINNVTAALSFAEQAAGFVPFPSETAEGYVPDGYLDLTNEELREQFGVSLGGGYPPDDAVVVLGIRALLDYTPGS